MRRLFITGTFALLLLQTGLCRAEEYFANVGTGHGTYSLSVEVEDGAVTKIYWPGGVEMKVFEAELNYHGLAKGKTASGDTVVIEVIGYE